MASAISEMASQWRALLDEAVVVRRPPSLERQFEIGVRGLDCWRQPDEDGRKDEDSDGED
jgi:transposase